MSNSTNKDIRTLGYVVKRTNYGEADRILNLITPFGKISAIAKSVRKEKSKLAGSIEIFTLTDFNIHFGNSEFGVVTGAKMIKHYSNIIKDLNRMETASNILKKVSKLADGSDSQEYFKIVDQSLKAIDAGENLEVINVWATLNLKKAMGEEINLYRDTKGDKLVSDKTYDWDNLDMAFCENDNGEYGANEIKFLRLMISSDLSVIRRVKIDNEMLSSILRFSQTVV